MATSDKVLQASSAADMQTVANAYLATLANPVIQAWSLQAADVSRRIGTEFRTLLTVDDGAGPALATPFLLDVLTATGTTQLEAAIAAYRLAYAGQFISGPKFLFIPDENVTASLVCAAFLRNTDPGASANYVITP